MRVAAQVLLALLISIGIAANRAAGANPEEGEGVAFASAPKALYEKASAYAPKGKPNVAVVEANATFTVDAQGNVTYVSHLIYKVLTQKGAEGWSEISMEWAPWHEEKPEMRARVVTEDFTEHPLDPKTITDSAAKDSDDDVYGDRRELRAPLPAIAPGAVVEVLKTIRIKPVFPGSGILMSEGMSFGAPAQRQTVTIEAPSGAPLRYHTVNLPDVQARKTEADGKVRVVFEAGEQPEAENPEKFLPNDVAAYPSVDFSTGESWGAIAEAYSKIVDEQIGGGSVKALAEKLTAGKATREEKAGALLEYVSREVRYTGVEFDEAAIVPRTPAETLKRKYGDCKDKAALLAAMYRAAGIPAYLAMLNAGARLDVTPDLPGFGEFDHAILYAPGSPDLWVDVTDEYARLGQLPPSDQGRYALIAKPGTTGLVKTPESKAGENMVYELREIFLAENGAARIVETSRPKGSAEASYRSLYADTGEKVTRENLTKYMKEEYLAEKLDRAERSDPKDFTKSFELVLESKQAKRGTTEFIVAVAAIRIAGLFSELPRDLRVKTPEPNEKGEEEGAEKKSAKPRTADYQLTESHVKEWQYRIHPPAGFEARPLPKDVMLQLGPATLTEKYSKDAQGVVHADFRFELPKRRLSAAEAKAMQDKIVEITGGEAILIYFDPAGENLLRAGKVKEALQAYRGMIAQHPKEALHHLQLAQAFLTAGLGEPARKEAQAAQKLEPNSALAAKIAADILQYDLVGRKLQPGSDYAGAVAAYRTAQKLDPSDKVTTANLGILLEYNNWGLRYGPGSKLNEAVAEYQKLKAEDRAELGIPNNMAFALFYAGDFAGAKESAEAGKTRPTGLIAASMAALEGREAGLAEAHKRAENDTGYRSVVRVAGQMLANARKYPLAADFLEAGATGENASELAANAVIYRTTVPHEQVKLGNDPQGVAQKVQMYYMDPKTTDKEQQEICSRNSLMASPKAEPSWTKEMEYTVSLEARSGVGADLALDLALARSQPKVQGDDKTGYKVTMYPATQYKYSIYIVKEGGLYKALSTSSMPAGVAVEAAERLQAGDLEGTKALLDWVREDHHLPGDDDPLSGGAFVRVWSKGKTADAITLSIATGALLGQTQLTAERGVTLLESVQAAAKEREGDKLGLTLAMAEAYSMAGQQEKALPLTLGLAKQYPESKQIFLNAMYQLRSVGKTEDAEAMANARLKQIPDDLDAQRALVEVYAQEGHYEQAHAAQAKILEHGNAEAQDYNLAAWMSLFTEKVTAEDVEYALKAAQLGNKSPSALHTLGCVYAATGKIKDAKEVLVQTMSTVQLNEPNDAYWYAFGLIAEGAGERETAIEYYGKLKEPKGKVETATSSYALAQMRLKALKGGTK